MSDRDGSRNQIWKEYVANEPHGHPAPFNREVIMEIARIIDAHPDNHLRILDPFAGIGRIHVLPELVATKTLVTAGLEIESEWADWQAATLCVDATDIPFGDARFDMVITSPTYGNRMADHHDARDGSKRRTYRHGLGEPLHLRNTGRLQWGTEYRVLHEQVWDECVRVLRPGGWMLLNVKDHVRGGRRIPVTAYHIEYLGGAGLNLDTIASVSTASMKHGQNRDARVGNGELIVAFRKPEKVL